MTTYATTEGFPALGFDPAPGELDRISEASDTYLRVKENLRFADDALRDIIKQRGVWQGEASDAFARKIGDLPEYLETATRSMAQASDALSSWTSALGDMKRQAVDLEAMAREASQAAEQARGNPDFALAGQTFTDQAALTNAQARLDDAGRKLEEAINRCESVQQQAERLLQQHTEIAERTAELLKRARELAPEEPGLLAKGLDALGDMVQDLANFALDTADAMWNVVQDNANLIAKLSDVVGDIGNILGVVGDFLPPPAGEIVGAVATGFGVAALGGHALAMAAGGDVAPETLIFDAIGAATSLGGIFTPPGGSAALKVIGYGAIGLQTGIDAGSNAAGDEKAFEGPIDDFKNYWVPKNGAQWAVSGSSLILGPGPAAAVAFYNAAEQGHAEDTKLDNRVERARDKAWE